MVTKKKQIEKKPINRLKKRGTAGKNGKFDLLNNKTQRELINLFTSTMQRRSDLANRLGYSFKNDERDLYKALGFPQTLQFQHYWAFYTREGVATKVVDIPVDSCWQKPPELRELGDEGVEKANDTKFETEWKELVKKRKIWHYLTRIDKLSGIGKFGVLLMGFNDGAGKLEEEVTRATELIYLRPYKEDSVSIETYESNTSDERYGLPLMYRLKITKSEGGEVEELVHWSRLLHVAEGLLEDDIMGIPRMRNVYNLIAGLNLVSGGSGEMFWRGAFPGLAFILDKDAELDVDQDSDALNSEINDYIHDLQRTIKLQGMKIQSLAPQVADPSKHVEILMTMIAASRGIPKRIFMGTERGELASSQDESAWNRKIEERQTNYCDPGLVRPFVDRCISVGVLPEPKEGYEIEWPDVSVPTEEQTIDIAKKKTEALVAYSNSSATELLPFDIFLKEILGLSDELIEQVQQRIDEDLAADIEDEEANARLEKEMETKLIQDGIAKISRDEKVAKIATDKQRK